MQESRLKMVIKKVCFPEGATRRIRFGPLRGALFRVSAVTGMSPWYSGPERAHQRVFSKLIKPGNVVIDVGANWGSHTLLFSQLTGPDGLVVALEPLLAAFSELEWHIKANGCHNTRAIQVAASDKDGKAFFTVAESPWMGGLTEAYAHQQQAVVNQIAVPTRTLDSLVAERGLKRIDLVKIDVEGAESKVLLGGRDLIRRFQPCFVIDLHTPEQDVGIAQLLTAEGYRLTRLSGPPILRTDVGWPNRDGVWGTIIASTAGKV